MMSSSSRIVVRAMATKGLSVSHHHGVVAMGDGGVSGKVFLISLVFLVMVRVGAVNPRDGSPPPLRAQAPSTIPPPPPLTGLQQSQQAVRALQENNFTTAAELIRTYMPILQMNSTLFVPTNEALAAVSASTPILTLLLYHAAKPQYSLEQLSILPIGTRLATNLGNASIVVTNNERSNYQVNNVRIVLADVCASEGTNLQISCHGVEAVLNATLYGHSTSAPSPVPVAPSPPVPFVLPGPPAVPIESPVAQSPTKSPPTGGGSCRVRTTFRHLAYIVFLGIMSLAFGFRF